MGEIMISVKNLKKKYRNKLVLDRLSFDVKRGSIFALLGENGAGKTTTIRILSTLIKSDEGLATIGGYDCTRDASKIRKIISLTGQYAAVDELLTGEENLRMMGELNHLDSKKVKKRTVELLEQFDLVDAAKKPVKSYSGGMRRRLDIAISLIASPEVIFLDEPTTGLDPRSRMYMWEMIQNLALQGVTIFLTTQYLDEADRLADNIALLSNGKVVAQGTAEELKRVVGEETIELIFQDISELDRVKELLEGRVDDENLTFILTTGSTPEFLRQVLNNLHVNGIKPQTITFRKPTLDDVFMMTTNRKQEGVFEYV